METNADKCHLLVSSDESCTAKIEDFSIKNSTEEKSRQFCNSAPKNLI